MIATCPQCKDRPVVSPSVQLLDMPCDMCDGEGFVDTECVCECGRPAVRVIADTMTCTKWECIELALKVSTAASSIDRQQALDHMY